MDENLLFPVFDVPEINPPTQPEQEHYRPSVFFDFETGDFARDGANRMVEASGKEAYEQWCTKIVATERDAFLAYSTNIGVEMEYADAQPDRESAEASVERTIIEALEVNPKTEYVRDFKFSWNGTELTVSFAVKGRDLDEIRLSTAVQTASEGG